MIELHRINGTFLEVITRNSSSASLRSLDVISLPDPYEERYYNQEAKSVHQSM